MRNDTVYYVSVYYFFIGLSFLIIYIFVFLCSYFFVWCSKSFVSSFYLYLFYGIKKKCYYFLFVIHQSNLFFSSVHLHIFSSIHVFAHVFFICMVVGFLITFLIRPVGREGQQKLYECYYIAAKLIMIIFSPIKFLFIKNVIILEGLCPLKIKISRFNSFLPGNLISVRRFLQKEGCIS